MLRNLSNFTSLCFHSHKMHLRAVLGLFVYRPKWQISLRFHTAISRKVVGKDARDNPERYCGWFWVHGSLKKFERMAREAMDICLRVLKESNKSRFDSCSIRNSVLIISHITFRDCRLHIFSDNLSRNSYILQLVKSPPLSYTWSLKKLPLRAQPPRKGHYREYPTERFSLSERKASRLYYKWHSIIKDVPTQLQISGRTRTSETGGEWEFNNSLTERKQGAVIFLTLKQCTAVSTKPGFCFLLSLNVKNTVQV